jgi:hypothetical protein
LQQSEWSIEHAWKAVRWSDIATHRSTFAAAPFNDLTPERCLLVFPRK